MSSQVELQLREWWSVKEVKHFKQHESFLLNKSYWQNMKVVGEKLISIVVHDIIKTAEQRKYKRSDSINNHKLH